MSNIDERVVRMLFDNSSFEHNAATTLGTLDKLNKGLELKEATKGLEGVGEAAGGIRMEPLAAGVEAVSQKFSALSVIGYTAIATITSKIVDMGIEMAKNFTIEPIKAGFENYETQINAVQTILANTASEGTKIEDVNKALAELNTYANQTIYNFSEMTQNIGTFTAAGVDLKTSVESIKGIANLAAISGSSSQQATTAMYQLSQAISAGKVQLQDWNSVVNAGLGGQVFQHALENTARASGVAIDSIVKKAGGFRNSLQEGWLTSGILTKTLAQFTGDLSAAQLKAMGFTKQQADQILAMGQTAVNAATKIKTMTQLTDALKEEVATAYGAIFKTVFGDITQATDLFTLVHNAAENALTGPIYALNTLLQGWSDLGGRVRIIDGITKAFRDLAAILKPIKDAFVGVFPPATAQQLYNLSVRFDELMGKLKIGGRNAEYVEEIFTGLFNGIRIGFDLVEKLAGVFFHLFGVATQGSSMILAFVAHLASYITMLRSAIEYGTGFNQFFVKLQAVLTFVINQIRMLPIYIEQFFKSFDLNGAGKTLEAVSAKFSSIRQNVGPIGQLGSIANKVWAELFSHLDAVAKVIDPLAEKFYSFFKSMGVSMAQGLASINFSQVLGVINTGLFGGLLLLLKKFIDKMKGGGGEGLGGFVDTVKETFESMTKTLETMQGTLKAATLLEIAAAVGILTISAMELAKIDAGGLARSSAALTAMFTQLVTSMAIFQKFVGTSDFAKMPVMMGSLILLAIAIDVMTSSVKKLAALDWEGVHKGVTGLSIILTVLAGDVRLMGNPESMISTGLGLTALAKGVKILSDVVVILGTTSWESLAKGLVGVGGVLVSLALFSKFAEADAAGASQGAGIILLAIAIKILASAMQDFGKFSWTEIAKGLAGVAGGLSAIAVALKFMPPSTVFSAAGVIIIASSLGLIGDAIGKMGNLRGEVIAKGLVAMAGALALIAAALFVLPPSTLLSAAGIFIVAASLGKIGDVLAKMGGQSWSSIAKGLIELAGSLTVIALAVVFMEGALPGAAALLVVAAALELLAPVLEQFGQMSLGDMVQSLIMLAGVFAILGAAGILLAPVTPVLLALGGAILLIGLGTIAAGAGLLLFSAALTALSISGAAGTAALVAFVTAMINLLPLLAKQVGLALIAFAQVVGTAGPAITKAIVTVVSSILDAIVTLTPKIISTFGTLLTALLDAAVKYIPKMVVAGIKLITGVLEGIAQNIGPMITAGANAIVAFLKGIGDNIPKLVQAAFDLIIKFITALGDGIKKNSAALGDAAGQMAVDIIDGLVTGIQHAAGKVVDAIENVASDALSSAASWLGISSPSKEFAKIGRWCMIGWANAVTDSTDLVKTATQRTAQTAVESMKNAMFSVSNAVVMNVDLTPTITPVLDLSGVKKDASKLSGMLTTAPLTVDATYAKATIVSAGYVENQIASSNSTPVQPTSTTTLNFTQNNTSPKELPPSEIYRMTNNQLSQARGVLVYQGGSA